MMMMMIGARTPAVHWMMLSCTSPLALGPPVCHALRQADRSSSAVVGAPQITANKHSQRILGKVNLSTRVCIWLFSLVADTPDHRIC
eukprot:850754-Amphidinium_carterae.1